MHGDKKTKKRSQSKRQNDIIVAFSIAVLTSIGALYLFHQYETIKVEQISLSKSLALSQEINDIILKSKGEAAILAEDPYVIQALSDNSKKESKTLSALLDTTKRLAKASIVYIMDSDGNVIDCTPYGTGKTSTLTGKNYKFRPYFTQALSGNGCVYLALGVTTNKRGIYYSAPIYRENSNSPVGVVVIKKSLDKIDACINNEDYANALLVSPDGIIFSASNKNWMYKSIAPLDSKKAASLRHSKQFGNQPLSALSFRLDRESTVIDNRKYRIISHSSVIPRWELITLWNMHNRYPIIFPIIAVFSVFLLTMTIALYIVSLRHRKILTAQVREQNMNLVAANQSLKNEIKSHMQAERELTEAKNLAETATVAKSAFLANMSHEIRTPMNGVIGMAELLFETPLSKEQKEYCLTIMKSAGALLTVLNDILDFSKMEAGRLEIERVPCNIHDIIDSVGQLFATKISKQNLNIHVRYEPGAPNWVKGDPVRIQQILSNLMGNAVKFTSEGDIIISAKVLERDGDDIVFEFSVKDSGIGIAKDKLNTIFDEFSQADISTTRKFGGTGLGLTITNQLVNLMGGKIRIESQLGEGSEVIFTLPFQVTKPVKSEYTRKTLLLKDLKGLKVLIVDDNKINRQILSELMGRWEFRSHEAEDAKSAIELLKTMPPDDPYKIIITDNQMPEMDGVALAKEVKANPAWANIAIIMLSSMNLLIKNKKTAGKLFDAFLLKPVRHFNLMDVILTTLHNTQENQVKNSNITKINPPRKEKCSQQVDCLLVEDNHINQKLATALLNKIGCCVDLAENGKIALDKVQTEMYDIVFMDCQMPIMDGYEATAKIRELEKNGILKRHIPIVAMTANAMEGDREACIEVGMDDYISKPIKKANIMEFLQKYTKWTKNEQ